MRNDRSVASPSMDAAPDLRLEQVDAFGPNPGNLRMYTYAPARRVKRCPLVVVLHGCRQSAEAYARGSGWTRLAEEQGFVLLLPEQKTSNNHYACFSWFEPKNTRRGSGEAASIREMIAKVCADHGVDRRRVFICGLSAGGAMTAAMLAAYPEIFAGGTIIAGLPFGSATNASQALDSMSSGRIKEARTWGDAVRGATDYKGPWPTVSIWQGTADTTVRPINAGELVKQWTNVHGLGAVSPAEDRIGSVTRRAWRDDKGVDRVVEYMLQTFGHGAPVDADGVPDSYFLPSTLSSTRQTAKDWGIIRARRHAALMALLPFKLGS